jgi:hypothetical protein
LLLGRLAGPSHTALVVVFHLARIVGGAALLLVSYRFLAEFLPHVSQRRFGLVLVALGGGLGWLVTLLVPNTLYGSLPIDLISPEAYSFLVLFGLPHLAVARSLLLLGLLAYLHRRGVAAGLLWLGVGLLQPLYVPVAWLIVAMDLLLEAVVGRGRAALALGVTAAPTDRLVLPVVVVQRLRTAVVAGLISAPMLLYTIYVFTSDPILALWNSQNRLPSPHPAHYVLGYAAWLVPAVFGWRALHKISPRLARFAGGWLLLAPVLLYLPIPTQRRLIEAVQLPMAALAILGLTGLADQWRRVALAVLAVLTIPTALLIWAGAMVAANQPGEPIFLAADQADVFEWLAIDAEAGQVALAAYETGNALPAYTPLTAYIGHGPETIHLEDKRVRVARFYAAESTEAERRALLDDGRIRYVLVGPHERVLGDFDAGSVDYLALAYRAGAYAVYRVLP